MLADWLDRMASVVTSRIAPGSLPQIQERRILRLLGRCPMNTRELERRSGVPRDQVYEILGRLYERRAVLTAPSGLFWSSRPRRSSTPPAPARRTRHGGTGSRELDVDALVSDHWHSAAGSSENRPRDQAGLS